MDVTGQKIQNAERHRTPAFKKALLIRAQPPIHALKSQRTANRNQILALTGTFDKGIENR